ncbi:MAG: hypothetical protein ACK4SA_23220 [Caldilinea sp.]
MNPFTEDTIQVTVSDFTGNYSRINRSHCLDVSPGSLFWAAITVGAGSYAEALGSTQNSFAFALHKVMALLTVVNFDDGRLKLPEYYRSLDQSEKASLGYWAGMAMCKLIGDKILGIPWLLHVGSHRDLITWTAGDSRSAPDLIGKDTRSRWHVMEAKSRQNRPSAKDRKKWKHQAGRVAAISGTRPETNSYCLTLIKDLYSVELVDPPPEENDSLLQLEISPEGFWRTYYQPFVEFIGQSIQEDRGEIVYRPAALDPVTGGIYEIGVHRRVLESPRRARFDYFLQPDSLYQDGIYYGSDGISVRYVAP